MRSRGFSTLILALLLTGPAHADQLSIKLSVTASVVANCRVTLTPLSFGTYDPLGANATSSLDAVATMDMNCTRNARATIAMDSGRNASFGGAVRKLGAGSDRVGYQIYRDAARTAVWGNATDAVQFISGGLRASAPLIVYGRIPAGQEVASGTYSDVVTATIDF